MNKNIESIVLECISISIHIVCRYTIRYSISIFNKMENHETELKRKESGRKARKRGRRQKS